MLDLLNQVRQPLRKGHATAPYAYQRQVGDSVVLFYDLMGQADQRPLNLRGRHELPFLSQV